jgi:hypothetical protein
VPTIAWTYTTLLQALQDWPVHSSNLYLANLPNIIGLGERRLWGDLNVEEYDHTDTTSIQMTPAVRTIPKPADTIQLRTVGYYLPAIASVSGQQFMYLEQRSSEYCQMFAPDSTVRGPPQYYHELAFDHIEVVPTPDLAYQMYFRYIGTPPETLSSATPTTTTWLARTGPDALFAACLMEAEHFIKADDRYQDYMTKYQQELLPRLRNEIRKSIRAGDYSPMKGAATIAQ